MEPLEGVSTLERKLLHQASRTRIPINGSIELLPLCNMNCDMCYVRLTQSEMEQKGQLHSVSEWLNLAQQMQKSGVLFLLLTGGEPLLYPGFRELYVELQKLGMILTINTNGTLIDEETASFLGSHKPRRVNITLYGADETAYRELCHYPGGFEKTIRGIRLLRKNDIDVKLSTSLTKANRSDIDRIISLGKELDIPVRTDTYMLPAVRERTQSHALNSRLEPYEAAEARIQALKSEMGADLFSQFVQQTLEKI
ncbi:MAG: radical SAM protein, partial [Emergencia sp.]|nr:radical SAM protein [Emergencia sp.]